MSRTVKSIRFPHAHEIRRILGLNAGKLPTNLTEQHYSVGGLKFRLLPARTTPVLRSRPHRLEVECPVCNKWMSVGRFNQHQGTHPRETLSELSRQYIAVPYHQLDEWIADRWLSHQ